MKAIHWLFVVSAALFVSGIGFVLAAERTARTAAASAAPAATAARAVAPVATVKQVMDGIVSPAAMFIWDSVATTISASGTEEKRPETDDDWAQVATNAALLVESANLLVDPERALDDQDWPAMAKAMADAASKALDAAKKKSPDAILEMGDELNQTCDRCHERYSRN
jgi:hypothetical protein